ncbi:MAG TPA: hypothetical protein VJV78_29325 [Polyangiales bacterium]|nr:hypothetical protein [Polyangiales bacterium]
MLRAFLTAAVVAAGLFVFAPDSAAAQFAPLAMQISLESNWDITVTGNSRFHCKGQLDGSDEPAYIRLEPEIGAVSWKLRRFYCADIVVDIFTEMTTGDLKSEPHTVYPLWAELYTQISVVYDLGAGPSATVFEQHNRIFPYDGWEITYPYNGIINTPGVVISSASDRMTAELTP